MPMPSRRAASALLPAAYSSTLRIWCRSRGVEGHRIGGFVPSGSGLEFGRKRIGRQRAALGHDHAPFHDVAQLADVAAPRVAFQRGDIGVVDFLDPLPHLGRELFREMAGVLRDVLFASVERRQDRKSVV